MWHGHLLFHEDHGMMQLLEVVRGGRPQTIAAIAPGADFASEQSPLECHLPPARVPPSSGLIAEAALEL